ncbi:transposase [Ensifer adhaerens]|nr:transposase [Ensifer adhaerens]
MKTSRFSEPQILAILRQAEGGVPVPDLCREHGMSTASFYIYGLFPRCKLDVEAV